MCKKKKDEANEMKVTENMREYIPKKQQCNHCNSKLEIQASDLKYEDGYHYLYFVCPCCKNRSIPLYRTTEPKEECYKIDIQDFISAKKNTERAIIVILIFFVLIFFTTIYSL